MAYIYDKFQTDIINSFIKKSEQKVLSSNNIADLNINNVSEILDKKFTDVSDMEIIKEVFDVTLLQHNSNNENGVYYPKNSIVNEFKNIRLATTTESTQGYALLSGFREKKDLFIIKTTRNTIDNDNSLYEYFIGTYGINGLRKYIPNFCYTFGMFRCEPLDIKSNSDIADKLCKNTGGRNYVIYEKIPGETLQDVIINDDVSKYLFSYILQLYLALQVAYEKIGFVHYDLHPGNVMIRKLKTPIELDYDIGGVTYRVKTDAIATIIDYGFSHFVYGGVQFGGQNIADYSVSVTTTPCGFDMFKLMGFVVHLLYAIYGHTEPFVLFFRDLYGYYPDQYKIIESWDDENELKRQFINARNQFWHLPEDNPFYYNEPIEFVKWAINKKFVKNDTLTIIDKDDYKNSTNFIEEYKKVLDKGDLYNVNHKKTHNVALIYKDEKSNIVNSYKISNINEFIDKFENTLTDSCITDIKQGLKYLSDVTMKNSYIYSQNDKKINDHFNNYLSLYKYLEEEYNKLYENMRSKDLLELEYYKHDMTIIKDYCNKYQDYAKFVYCSKWSDEIPLNKTYKSRYYNFKKVYKAYKMIYSEKIFSQLFISVSMFDPNLYKMFGDENTDKLLSFNLSRYQYSMYKMIHQNTIVSQDVQSKMSNFVLSCIKTIVKNGGLDLIYITPCTNIQISSLSYMSMLIGEKTNSLLDKIIKKYINPQGTSKLLSNHVTIEDNEFYKIAENYRYNSIRSDITGLVENYIDEIFSTTRVSATTTYLDIDGGNGRLSKIIGNNFGIDSDKIICIGDNSKDHTTIDRFSISSSLPFPDNEFGLVTMFHGFQSIENMTSACIEIERVLKKDGYLVIRENNCSSDRQKTICDIDKIFMNRYANDISLDENTIYIHNLLSTYRTRESINSTLKKAGFSLVHIIDKGDNITGVYYEIFKK